MGSTPKAPKASPQQLAFERAQQEELNKQIQAENRRRKALTQGNLGVATLLANAPSQTTLLSGQTNASGTLNGGRPGG